jgi:hypothetical protein
VLEREVHAERRQRTLAESLRACLATVSGTLEPAEVLDRLLHAAGELIHYDAACICWPVRMADSPPQPWRGRSTATAHSAGG